MAFDLSSFTPWAPRATDCTPCVSGLPAREITIISAPRKKPRTIVCATAVNDDKKAVEAFLRAAVTKQPGGCFYFRDLLETFEREGEKTGWPILSPKRFSQNLSRAGCRRFIKDGRRRGGSRLVVFELPRTLEWAI